MPKKGHSSFSKFVEQQGWKTQRPAKCKVHRREDSSLQPEPEARGRLSRLRFLKGH